MLDFRTIELTDKPWIDELLRISDFRGCEYCFANNMAWRRMYNTQITRFGDFYLSCSFSEDGKPHFTYPAGGASEKASIWDIFHEMDAFAAEKGADLEVGSVSSEKLEIIRELFPDRNITVIPDEDSWDYVYNVSDLAELAGKRYHGKRNHLKKLLESDYSFELMTENDFDDCIEYAARSYAESGAYDERSKVCEQFAINTYFSHFNELGLMGGVLRQSGRVIGFTIGERINSDTLGIHIEKAEAAVQGAYAAVNNLFIKALGADFTYVNREEDLGIEGLRKAKRSYHPAFMIEKMTVIIERK